MSCGTGDASCSAVTHRGKMPFLLLWFCVLWVLSQTAVSLPTKYFQNANGHIVALPRILLDEDDVFTSWSSWGPCSVTVGVGVMTRTRTCRRANCRADTGLLEDNMKCFVKMCDCPCSEGTTIIGRESKTETTASPTTHVLRTCSRSLGTSHQDFLPNSSFSASSFLDSSKRPLFGRLGNPSIWCPETKNPGIEYLMIDLKQEVKICGVATQGDGLTARWTRDYYIEYSRDGLKWNDVALPNGKTKVFSGNQDGTSVSKEFLPSTIVAQYVRFYPLQFHGWPCLKVDLIGHEIPKPKLIIDPESCQSSALGASRGGALPNAAFSASSSYDSNEAYKGRLNGPSAWCSMSSNRGVDFIQISLEEESTVCAVATQGVSDFNGDSWVTSYLVAFSSDETEWRTIKEYGKNKMFKGNTDTSSVVKQSFPQPIMAKHIRLYPEEFRDWVCMRVELYGAVPPTCEPLGLAAGGALKNSSFAAHSSYVGEEAFFGRLNGKKAWCARDNENGTYLQVDLGCVAELCSVETQGYAERSFWTTSYFVKFSMDGKSWEGVNEHGKLKVFDANSDGDSVVRRELPDPILARYVRLYPQTFETWMCLRAELHGKVMKKIDIPTSAVKTVAFQTPSSTRRGSLSAKINPTSHRSTSVWGAAIQPTPQIMPVLSPLVTQAKPTDPTISACLKNPLGAAQGGRLPDSAFSASSSWGAQQPRLARLHGASGWCTGSTDHGPHFQVDLGAVVNVCAVATQGIEEDDDWVRSFFVQYSEDGASWVKIQESGKNKVFQANKDSSSVVTNGFPVPVPARYVRIFPDKFDGWMCLRLELYGDISAGARGISAKALT